MHRFKKALYGSTVVVACLTTSWVVAQALPAPSVAALLQTQRDVTVTALADAIARGDDGIGPLPTVYINDEDDLEEDDAYVRALWLRLNNGPILQQSLLQLMQETDTQATREKAYTSSARKLTEVGAAAPTPATSLQWVPLGPQSALSEWNGSEYDGMDSGRVATIRVDPTNPATVYIGAIGGGIWKTPDITVVTPVWTPLTNTLGTMFIGSFDLDPTNPQIIHAGLGDYWEGNPGGVMVTTKDGGATWGPPRPLSTSNGVSIFRAVNTRTVRIDPNDHNNILVASDVGLFRSTNGG
ncbi:MAG TPA: hypothetical protein VLM79_01305, partial [Kofleriaceae bacterium]|nr:hypothetical protein [Kofleriaceae bacterium]